MPQTDAAPDPHRLARAYLALTDAGAPEPPLHSFGRGAAAFAAALALAVAAPLGWTAATAGKVGDQPAATLGGSKASPAEDEDDDGVE